MKLGAPGGVGRQQGIEVDCQVFLGNGRADQIRGLAYKLGVEHFGEVG